jgi:YVTN family beta-propeller protein
MTMKPAIYKRFVYHVLGMLVAAPLAAQTVQIYVANHAGTQIQVIDAATNRIVQTIRDVEAPEGVQFSPDGSRVYITTASENVLTVVERTTGRVVKKVPLSGHANDLAVTKDGKHVLVCIAETPGAIDVIDTGSLTLVKTIPAKTRGRRRGSP